MANNPDNPETFHEVPASKYWYLGDSIGAVPKAFFKFWTPFIFITAIVLTLLTEHTTVWATLATYIYVTHWQIGIPATLVTVAVTYFYLSRRQKRIRKQRAEQLRIRRYQNALINQHDAGVKQKK